MDFSSHSSTSTASTPSFAEQRLANCPSTPNPCQGKLQITFDDTHIFIPSSNGSSKQIRLPIDSFPSLPFEFPNAATRDTQIFDKNSTPLKSTTSDIPKTLARSGRRTTLAHIDQRQRSYGARCA